MYDIILDAARSNIDPVKLKHGLHVDGIVGLVETPILESLDKKIHEFSMNKYVLEETTISKPPPQSTNANNVQSN